MYYWSYLTNGRCNSSVCLLCVVDATGDATRLVVLLLDNEVKLANISVTPTINLCVGIFGDVTAVRKSTTEHAIVAHCVITTQRGVNCVLTPRFAILPQCCQPLQL